MDFSHLKTILQLWSQTTGEGWGGGELVLNLRAILTQNLKVVFTMNCTTSDSLCLPDVLK